jgi:hypothetical protein
MFRQVSLSWARIRAELPFLADLQVQRQRAPKPGEDDPEASKGVVVAYLTRASRPLARCGAIVVAQREILIPEQTSAAVTRRDAVIPEHP